MLKKILYILSFVGVAFLAGCGSSQNQEQEKYLQIKVSNYVFQIPSDFIVVNLDKTQYGQFKILQAYKRLSSGNFQPSLIIGKYVGSYPKNIEKFFNIVEDKFVRKVPGTQITKDGTTKIGKTKAYYFLYKVNDSLFSQDSKVLYWGFQIYLFQKDEVYVISYVTDKKDDLNKMFDLILSSN